MKKTTTPELDAINMKSSHTPTPWKAKGKFLRGPAIEVETIGMSLYGKPSEPTKQMIDSSVGSCFLEEDTAHIVKCVNAHELLVEVAKQAMADAGDCSCSDHKCLFCLAQEALSQAEGK